MAEVQSGDVMQMRSVGRAAPARVLAVIMIAAFAALLPIAPARADNNIPLTITTQQTFNGKTYGFCFSGITAKAGSNPIQTIAPSCSGTFSTSTSVPVTNPLLITFYGPITVTCPNGKVATTKLGSTGALYSFGFALGVNAWFPMAAWVVYISP